MRLNLANESVEAQISDLLRDIQELKTRQFTSQNSGMLGRINGAADKDDFGDIVTLSGSFSVPPNPTSHIPCPATPGPAYFNSIYCQQTYETAHDKPAVVVPYVQLEVKSGGLTGKSTFTLQGYRFMFYMPIYQNGAIVGEVYMVQDLGDYLKPKYNATTPYAWQTVISYTSTVAFELSYKFLVRSSDRGATTTTMEGLFF